MGKQGGGEWGGARSCVAITKKKDNAPTCGFSDLFSVRGYPRGIYSQRRRFPVRISVCHNRTTERDVVSAARQQSYRMRVCCCAKKGGNKTSKKRATKNRSILQSGARGGARRLRTRSSSHRLTPFAGYPDASRGALGQDVKEI